MTMTDESGLCPEDVTFQISGFNIPTVVAPTLVSSADHPIFHSLSHPECSLSHTQMSLQSLPDGKSEGPATVCSERCVTSEHSIQMPLNRDNANVCKSPAVGYTSRHDCHHPTEECSRSLPTMAVGNRGTLGSDNTHGRMSTSKCCTMLADMATILERLNVLENSSDQCKEWPGVGTAYCLEQPLDTAGADSVPCSARNNPDDLLCPDVDIDGELPTTDLLCSPIFPMNGPTHARCAWDVTDYVVDSPPKQLLPQRVEEGECGLEEFDAGGDGQIMQQLASCQQDGRQFIDGSMVAETEEVEETSEAITNRVAWDVDITDLVARRGKKSRKTASAGKQSAGNWIIPYFHKVRLICCIRTHIV